MILWRRFLLFTVLWMTVTAVVSQVIDPKYVTIARDSFGVPHIFAPTDAEASYGLAWAHSEDDFKSIQENLLAAKGMLGRVQGTDGVLFDFALEAFEIDATVDAQYMTALTPAFRRVVDGYVQGINDYAAAHPKEVLVKKAFPVAGQDLIKGYVLTTSLMAGLGMALKAVHDDRIEEFYYANDVGSNAIAVAPSKMADGKAYLLSNSHQPNEGRFAWYEAHVQSNEGWNIVGGLFPGGLCIFTGSNAHLGWAHTTNYHNFGDIFQLKINPKNKHQYKLDGEWNNFREEHIHLVVKLAGLRIPVSKKAYWTEFGPALKAKQGMFAFRFPGYTDIRSGEQWFRMNKAQNIAEFEEALQMQAIPLFNVVYADDKGNTMLHSGGKVPVRTNTLDWKQPIASDNPAYISQSYIPYAQMPTLKNPACGYVYNANNTPLHASGEGCNWEGEFIGLQHFEYNRGEVLGQLLQTHIGKFTEAALDSIKFNTCYADDGSYMRHFQVLFALDSVKYPDIANAIAKLERWNHCGDADNLDAALVMLVHDALRIRLDSPFGLLLIREAPITEVDAVWAVRESCKFLRKYHGGLDVPLGQVQRLQRGDVSMPASGLREVPRAADASRDRKHQGTYRVGSGDCFIQVSRFSAAGVTIQNVNAFGSSNHPESLHYTDQMALFTNQHFKTVSMDRETILKLAERVYHPGQ